MGSEMCIRDRSRWVNVPAVSVRAVAVFASGEPDETVPSKDAIREAQEQAQAGFGVNGGWSSFVSSSGWANLERR